MQNAINTVLVLFVMIIINSCKENIIDEQHEFFISNQTVYKSEKEYCAFCDITYFNKKYYIAFRIGEDHAPYHDYSKNGYIKLMSSTDLTNWIPECEIVDSIWDLRDPNFCINPITNELFLNYGVYGYHETRPKIKNKISVLTQEGLTLKIKKTYNLDVEKYSDYWLWKIYWFDNKFWSIAYHPDKSNPILVNSEDGTSYKYVSNIPINGNETALCFREKTMIAISRNTDNDLPAYISESEEPYSYWNCKELNQVLQSPEIINAGKDKIFVAGRSKYGVSVYFYDADNMQISEYINLFANGNYGNYGYPGMICNNGILSIVYYACNDYQYYPSIYLTSLSINI